MKDYLMKMKSICDTLAACGRPVSEEDQVLSILAGLGSEYEPTVAVLTSRIESYNVQTASALLLASENRALQQLVTPEPSMSTNLAFYPKKNWQNNPGQQTTSRNNRGSYENFNNSGRVRGRNRTFHNKVVCQLCGKSGHTVQKCYHRFDISFSRLNNISNTPGQSLNASNSSSNVSSSNMTAMVAAQPEFLDDSCWFSNSGATNHFTNDIGQLSINSEYNGSGRIHMGNGTGLPISHIGHTTFPSNSRILHLKNLLHVPSITKNLISVSQFCTDNAVFFEFHSNSCFVKDRETKKVLLEGIVDEGLYKFQLHTTQNPGAKTCDSHHPDQQISSPLPYLSDKNSCNNHTSSICSFKIWHDRLRHPSPNIELKLFLHVIFHFNQ